MRWRYLAWSWSDFVDLMKQKRHHQNCQEYTDSICLNEVKRVDPDFKPQHHFVVLPSYLGPTCLNPWGQVHSS